jgi:hypothetical protein
MRFFYRIGPFIVEVNSLSEFFQYCLGQIFAYIIVIGLIVLCIYWLVS